MAIIEKYLRQIFIKTLNFTSRYRAILTLLLFTTVVIVAYIGRISTLYIFPFEAAVWGTFSDWTMVIVTSFTVYFLIRSFVAQAESNRIQHQTLREQQKITEIEQFIFKERVKPIFYLEVGEHGFKVDNLSETATAIYSFNFYTHNASAKDINTDCYLSDEESKSNKHMFSTSRTELHPGMNSSTMPQEFHQQKTKIKDMADYVFRFSFKIKYADILGNHYEQEIIFYNDSNGVVNTHQGGPKPIL